MSKHKQTIEGLMDVAACVAYLERFTNALKEGTLMLETGDEPIRIEPAGPLEIAIELSSKKGRDRLSLEIQWEKTEAEQSQEDALRAQGKKEKAEEKAAAAEAKRIEKDARKAAKRERKLSLKLSEEELTRTGTLEIKALKSDGQARKSDGQARKEETSEKHGKAGKAEKRKDKKQSE